VRKRVGKRLQKIVQKIAQKILEKSAQKRARESERQPEAAPKLRRVLHFGARGCHALEVHEPAVLTRASGNPLQWPPSLPTSTGRL